MVAPAFVVKNSLNLVALTEEMEEASEEMSRDMIESGKEMRNSLRHRIWIDLGDEDEVVLDVYETSNSSDEETVPVIGSKESPLRDGASHCGTSLSLLQEMHVESIYGCDEKVEEWEELEFLVDSGASATVVGKDQDRVVTASQPNLNRWHKMGDGNIIQNRGEKLCLAETDQYRSLQVRTQVAGVDK